MQPTLSFAGGVAVITGAASGIGMGLAHRAAALGMKVVLADINAAALDNVAKSVAGEVIAIATDVGDAAAVEQLAQRAWDHFGRVDLLFNNAGVMATGFIWEIEPERFRRSLTINIEGVLNGIRSFVPRMLAAGRPAHIVNTASVGGFLPSPLMAPYSASKFAVVALTESLLGELQLLQAPIGVSLLAPGPVQSGIFDDPFGDHSGRPQVQAFVTHLRDLLSQHGISPELMAERVFAGIQAGDYWLFTHPEAIDTPLRQRTETILARKHPVL